MLRNAIWGQVEFNMSIISTGRETSRMEQSASKSGVMGRVRQYVSRTRAERQLRMLDDRMLADVGVNRMDISRCVWGD
jgi:uncharacterized protein YjiS (DUF1127 family)